MKIIYDLVKNGLTKLNLPLKLKFSCIVLCQIIMVLWFSMYHVHENVVVVGIDLSEFSMYYLFKKNQICCWHWKCCGGGLQDTQQAASRRNPPVLPGQTATGKQPPRFGRCFVRPAIKLHTRWHGGSNRGTAREVVKGLDVRLLILKKKREKKTLATMLVHGYHDVMNCHAMADGSREALR